MNETLEFELLDISLSYIIESDIMFCLKVIAYQLLILISSQRPQRVIITFLLILINRFCHLEEQGKILY